MAPTTGTTPKVCLDTMINQGVVTSRKLFNVAVSPVITGTPEDIFSDESVDISIQEPTTLTLTTKSGVDVSYLVSLTLKLSEVENVTVLVEDKEGNLISEVSTIWLLY